MKNPFDGIILAKAGQGSRIKCNFHFEISRKVTQFFSERFAHRWRFEEFCFLSSDEKSLRKFS